jgi:hypothetical protein
MFTSDLLATNRDKSLQSRHLHGNSKLNLHLGLFQPFYGRIGELIGRRIYPLMVNPLKLLTTFDKRDW